MKERLFYIILLTGTLVVYITGLFPETTVDSAKYAAVSREIFENGDILHLKIHGEPYLQKPPLHFWLSAIFFRIFGLSMVAFKLPTLLFTILGLYSTFRLGKLQYGRQTGLVAALLFITSEAVLLFNMDVHTDMMMTSCIIFGTWQLAEYLEYRRVINFVAGFAGIGLAMLSKGLIGLAVPVFAIGGYLLLQRDFKNILSLRWIAGAVILLLVISPALKGLYDQFGWEGIRFYFWSNNIDRISGEYSDNRHDYSFALHTFLYLFLPWTFYAVMAFIDDWKGWRNKRFRLKGVKNSMNYIAFIPLAVLVSISSQQSPHYLLPLIPFLSIITAGYLVRLSDRANTFALQLRIAGFFSYFTSAFLWILICIIVFYFFPVSNFLVFAFLILLLAGAVLVYYFERRKLHRLLILLSVSILAFAFVTNTVYMPSALKYQGIIQACYKYNETGEALPLYTYGYSQYESYFYADRVSEKINTDELVSVFNDEPAWLITNADGFREITNDYPGAISEQYQFPYKKLTNVSFKFLNPSTRESTLKTIYLLKLY